MATATSSTKKIDTLLDKYGESHQNKTNKLIHWICVPTIMFSLLGMLYCIPFPGGIGLVTNWAAVFYATALIYYLTLSLPMFLGFIVVGGGLVVGNHFLAEALASTGFPYIYVSLIIFVVAWIGQFIGHKIEGAKPSFLDDLQFLLIGPAWLLHFIYKKVGIKY